MGWQGPDWQRLCTRKAPTYIIGNDSIVAACIKLFRFNGFHIELFSPDLKRSRVSSCQNIGQLGLWLRCEPGNMTWTPFSAFVLKLTSSARLQLTASLTWISPRLLIFSSVELKS